jgi:hypothetical protein
MNSLVKALLAAILSLVWLVAPLQAINLLPTASRNITATSGGAATFNTDAALITTASLTTAAGVTASFTLSSPSIVAGSLVMASVGNGSNSAGTPNLASVTVTNGQAVVVIQNIHASAAFNGTLQLSVLVFN